MEKDDKSYRPRGLRQLYQGIAIVLFSFMSSCTVGSDGSLSSLGSDGMGLLYVALSVYNRST